MKKRFEIIVFILLISLPFILSQSVDSELKKLTHYAEDYEAGNIDYARLLIYSSNVRESLNEILGVVNRDEGGILSEEQVRRVLGEANEETRWIWYDNENREKKLDNSLPVWNKIIFDGKKIQIRLGAYPSLYSKHRDEYDSDSNENSDTYDNSNSNENTNNTDEEKIIYRLNFNVEFKKPQEQIDVNSKINNIKELAEIFNKNPSKENGEILAKESVNAEKAFESYFKQSSLICEDAMNSIFGSENKRKQEKIIVIEKIFLDGDNFVVISRLEMCDVCQWHWLGINFWVDSRGENIQNRRPQNYDNYKDDYKNYNNEDFKKEVESLLDKIKNNFAANDYDSAFMVIDRLNTLNEVWNEKSNDVWDDVNKLYDSKKQGNNEDRYFWVKIEQEKRKKVKELSDKNYQDRKNYYLNIFSQDIKKEQYFEQVEWERRLVENYKVNGEEICDNNIDDNNDGNADCDDVHCYGKFAGVENIQKEINGTIKEEVVELYCIEGQRKQKEEQIIKGFICGNNICEKGEEGICDDCSICETHKPIECNGKIIFSGKNDEGCFLKPICLEETRCISENDCSFRCGIGECVEGICKLKELNECKEIECVNGEEKLNKCINGEILITEICEDGLWRKTGLYCEVEFKEIDEGNDKVNETIINKTTSNESNIVKDEEKDTMNDSSESKEFSGNQCIIKEDCGNSNDVCSNGYCVTIPETISDVIVENTEISEKIENLEEMKESDEIIEPIIEPKEDEITGKFVFRFFNFISNAFHPVLTGKVTGYDVEETEEPVEESVSVEAKENEEVEEKENIDENEVNEENVQQPEQVKRTDEQLEEERRLREERERNREDERRGNEERERVEREEEERKNRCEENCNNNCEEIIVRCVEDCVFVEGTDETRDLDECKNKCKESRGEETKSCYNQCFDNCVSGQEFRVDIKREERKEQAGVFRTGGICREFKDVKEGFIFFDGWGEPFQDFHIMKNKYYIEDGEWCKWDLENLVKQRIEFEKSFNQEFSVWFFERYLANSAENWERHVSGIYEIYWKNVDNQRELANRMRCLGKNDINELYVPQLINFSYETKFGSIEYWEELKKVRVDKKNEEVNIISPYMKVWIFPNKEFLKSEMKKAMERHEFPGSEEEKDQQGPTLEEKIMLKQNKNFMRTISDISDRYNNGLDAVLQLKDQEEVVFNVLVNINEEDIFSMKPLLPEEISEYDVRMEIEFEKVYSLVNTIEKEMRGGRIEKPPWDNKPSRGEKINEIYNGIKMYFKVRGLINNAKVYPENAEKDIKKIAKKFLNQMILNGEPENREISEGNNDEDKDNEEEGFFESKEEITGEVIRLKD